MNELSRRDREVRLSAAERDEAVARIQSAYVAGRLEEQELDRRLRGAIDAVYERDLAPLLDDLPLETPPAPTAAEKSSIVAYGSVVERTGRWVVPAALKPIIYKGHLVLDLRAAHLLSDDTVVRVTSYKSTIEIIVPAGVAVDSQYIAYKGQRTADPGEDEAAPRKTVHIRGIAYKSKVVIRRSGRQG